MSAPSIFRLAVQQVPPDAAGDIALAFGRLRLSCAACEDGFDLNGGKELEALIAEFERQSVCAARPDAARGPADSEVVVQAAGDERLLRLQVAELRTQLERVERLAAAYRDGVNRLEEFILADDPEAAEDVEDLLSPMVDTEIELLGGRPGTHRCSIPRSPEAAARLRSDQ